MPGCELQHGSVRPYPILASPASPGNTWASSSPNWPTPGPPSTRPRWPTAAATHAAAPPRKPAKDAAAELVTASRQARTQQSSQRICVEHAIAEHKQWRSLQRYLGRREYFGETYLAVAGLVSDRAARR